MNKSSLCWNTFESLKDWNIITINKTSENNTDKNDEVFGTILRGVETRMSKKILVTIFDATRIDDESTDGYYIVQWTSESYTLQEDKEERGYIQLVIVYAGEIVCDTLFFNPVSNAKYWLTSMNNKRDGDTTVRLKQVLLPNITMMKIYHNN